VNLLDRHPSLARFGVNPFSVPALVAFAMCVVNFFWIHRRFKETLTPAARAEARDPRIRNPLSAILGLTNPAVRRANLVAFVYAIAFVAMESSLTFLAAERFGYTARQNGWLLGFLGVCSIVTQGFIVRKLLARVEETRVLSFGLVFSALGLLLIGFALQPWQLYGGLALLAIGSGLVNPATSGLISLYSGPQEQGRVLGIFRSLGSLARAITPILAGIAFWLFGSRSVFLAGAVFAAGAFGLSAALPKPVK
jgi:MFS family permease